MAFIVCIHVDDDVDEHVYVSRTSGDIWSTRFTFNKLDAKRFSRISDAKFRRNSINNGSCYNKRYMYCKIHVLEVV